MNNVLHELMITISHLVVQLIGGLYDSAFGYWAHAIYDSQPNL